MQSALLSSYDVDNLSVNMGGLPEGSELLPRLLEALCNLASQAYSHCAAPSH